MITISRKGQIVVPVKIRRKYNLRQGDRFLVRDKGGTIILEPLERHPLLGLRGAFKEKKDLVGALLRERHAERAREEKKRV